MAVKMATKVVEHEVGSREPDFYINATDNSGVDKDGNVRKRWVQIGAMWKQPVTDQRTGDVSDGFMIRINAMPLTWDGSMLCIPPKKDK